MVNWKEIPKIDAHIHLTPQDVILANSGCNNPFITNGFIGDYIDIMRQYNIERAIIAPFNDTYMMSMGFTVEEVHNNLINMIMGKEQSFYCFADVDIRRNVSQTLNEFDRVLKRREFVGIKIHPTNTGYPVDGDYYDKIFEYASKNNILVEIHSYPRDNLRDDVCSPSRIKRVIEKHPNLKLSIAHLGGFQYQDLTDVDAYYNLSAVLPDLVNRFGIGETNKILRLFDTERLVFATDYPDSRCLKPAEIYDRYFEILSQMDFNIQEAENICKFNAMKMIGRNN